MDEDDPSGLKALCPAYLEINTTQFTIVEYLIQEAQQREFTFSALKQVEKSFQNYRLLKLLFATGNLTCHYVFTSVLARQRFLELVQEHCFKVLFSLQLFTQFSTPYLNPCLHWKEQHYSLGLGTCVCYPFCD